MANTHISVREPSFGCVVLTCGQPGINHCRARIAQHGYHASVRAGINYNAIATGDVSSVEDAVQAVLGDLFTRAAALREANQPLFDLAVPLPHEEGHRP